MSIKFKKNTLFLRSKKTGSMVPVALVGSGADKSLEAISAYAEQVKTETEAQMQAKRDETVASIPDDYTKLSESVSEVKKGLANKIDKPSSAPTVGKVLKVTSVNDDGTFTCEWLEA